MRTPRQQVREARAARREFRAACRASDAAAETGCWTADHAANVQAALDARRAGSILAPLRRGRR